MPKNNRHGQSTLLSDADYAKIYRHIENPKWKIFLQIARYTGERWGAICQLKVTDVYRSASDRTPHTHVTFRASTRKGSPDGTKETRQVKSCPALIEALRAYEPPTEGWLFPGYKTHVTFDTADKMFREVLAKAGLDGRGISTHSTRRSFISKLAKHGVGAPLIRKLTGHKSLAALQKYIEIDDDQIDGAIALL